MNVYLIMFIIVVGIPILALLVLVTIYTIAYCRLILDKYPPEDTFND